jgi:hypothetical protein
MTNINGHNIAIEDFDIDAHALAPEYFSNRMSYFEERFHDKFPTGWGGFFEAYSDGLTEAGNLDYDEWAFLCEHFLRKPWQPPGICFGGPHEKPETDSGFSIGWSNYCLTHSDTSISSKERSEPVRLMRR